MNSFMVWWTWDTINIDTTSGLLFVIGMCAAACLFKVLYDHVVPNWLAKRKKK